MASRPQADMGNREWKRIGEVGGAIAVAIHLGNAIIAHLCSVEDTVVVVIGIAGIADAVTVSVQLIRVACQRAIVSRDVVDAIVIHVIIQMITDPVIISIQTDAGIDQP